MSVPFAPLPRSLDDISYGYGPDSAPRTEVQSGTIEELPLAASLHFPGTSRKVWVHRPAGHSVDEESAVMFFNDGWWYLDPAGDVRGAIVLVSRSAWAAASTTRAIRSAGCCSTCSGWLQTSSPT